MNPTHRNTSHEIPAGDPYGVPYQALLLVSFGGPEGPDDVMPFLENVLRGKNVPRQRMLEVAEHYDHFGGVSPINQQCRELIEGIQSELLRRSIDLPVFWGNRNWKPFLVDAIREMADAGIERSLAFFTSAYSCYSGCRQYRENVNDARQRFESESGTAAPVVDKLRFFFNHPKFVRAMADRVSEKWGNIPAERRSTSRFVFTAHSIPQTMADHSAYVPQLNEAARLLMDELNRAGKFSNGPIVWDLVFQSRSGPPSVAWLEPDVCDHLKALADENISDIVLMPIGFLSDHLEVLYDLDVEAAEACRELGLTLHRVATVGNHPQYVEMIVDLIEERIRHTEKAAIGTLGPSHDDCPQGCCRYPQSR